MNRKIGVILSYVLMIFEILSTLLLTPFILRTLGQAEYGVYRLSGTIVSYLLLLDLGVGNASVSFFSKYRANNDLEQGRKFLGVSIIYYAAVALLALIGGAVLIAVFPVMFAEGLSESETALGQTLLAITSVTACVTLITSPFYSSLVAHERFSVSRGASIISIILKIAFTFGALWIGMGSVGIVVINLVMTVLCRLFFVFYCFARLKLTPLFKGFDFSFIKEIVIYSSFILLQMLATQINASLGQIMLGALVPASAVIIGVYSVGTQIVQYYQSIGSSVTGVLMPGIVKLVESKPTSKQLCDEMVRIGRIILIILSLIWSGFLLFGKQFIILWAGRENADAFFVAAILLTAYMFILTESLGSQILWALNQHKEQALIKVIMVAANILLTFFLVKQDALWGVTLGTFIALLLGDLVAMNLIFKYKLKISLLSYYKDLLKGILPCVVVTLILGKLFSLLALEGWVGLIVNITFVCAVFGAAMLLFGMNHYEKNLIFGIFKKVFRRTGK